MFNIFRRKPNIIARNYLLTYGVINICHSLVNPVSVGHYAMTADGPADVPPDISAMIAHATNQTLEALDAALIGRHTGLNPEDLKPDNWRIVFTSIKQIN